MRAQHLYEFGHFRLDTAERALMRDGQRLSLSPKVYELLLILVRNHGHAIEKKELIGELWPDTFVEEGNLTQCISLLRKALGDGPEVRYIETIPKHGYRFVAEVVKLEIDPDPPVLAKKEQKAGWRPSRLTIAVSMVFVFLCALAYSRLERRPENTLVRSLAILPLRNPSQSDSHDVADGIAEALVTELAKIGNLRVVSFSRTQHFKGTSREAADIGRQLGVDAVLEGTIRPVDGRLRIIAHLVQSQTGFELWADDGVEWTPDNVIGTEHQLAEGVAKRIKEWLASAEGGQTTVRGTPNTQAYEFLLRGKQLVTRSAPSDYAGGTPSQVEIGRRMLERATELDPQSADAHAWLAYGSFHGPARTERVGKAGEIATNRALAIDPKSPAALMAKVFMETGRRPIEALAFAKRTLDANPEDLHAIAAAAEAYFYAGMLDRAIALYEKALAADPSNIEFRSQLIRTFLYSGQYSKGVDLLTAETEVRDIGIWAMNLYTELGNLKKAMEIAETSTRNLPDQYVGWYFAGCIFANAGQHDRARQIWLDGVRHTEDLLSRADNRSAVIFLALIYAKLGMREKALEDVRRILAWRDGHQDLYFVAKIHAILGDRREAIDCLKQAIAQGFLNLGWLDYHRRPHMGLHNIDGDPEFQSIRDDLAKKIDRLRLQY